VLDTVRELGIAFVAYSPIGRGLLSGAIRNTGDLAEDDFRRSTPRFAGENLERNLALVDAVREIAAELDVTPAQLSLAWLLARRDDIIPIPGTKRVRYLEENVGATGVELSADVIERLDAATPKDAVAGARYADMSSVHR
jgi:aryl-alcohol dehydrogenase-like predicted oxidoreductase